MHRMGSLKHTCPLNLHPQPDPRPLSSKQMQRSCRHDRAAVSDGSAGHQRAIASHQITAGCISRRPEPFKELHDAPARHHLVTTHSPCRDVDGYRCHSCV